MNTHIHDTHTHVHNKHRHTHKRIHTHTHTHTHTHNTHTHTHTTNTSVFVRIVCVCMIGIISVALGFFSCIACLNWSACMHMHMCSFARACLEVCAQHLHPCFRLRGCEYVGELRARNIQQVQATHFAYTVETYAHYIHATYAHPQSSQILIGNWDSERGWHVCLMATR
jgi:hypothetical protein